MSKSPKDIKSSHLWHTSVYFTRDVWCSSLSIRTDYSRSDLFTKLVDNHWWARWNWKDRRVGQVRWADSHTFFHSLIKPVMPSNALGLRPSLQRGITRSWTPFGSKPGCLDLTYQQQSNLSLSFSWAHVRSPLCIGIFPRRRSRRIESRVHWWIEAAFPVICLEQARGLWIVLSAPFSMALTMGMRNQTEPWGQTRDGRTSVPESVNDGRRHPHCHLPGVGRSWKQVTIFL